MRERFDRASARVSSWTGHPVGLFIAIVLSLALWWLIGAERTILIISFLTWWQLFPLQASQNRDGAAQQAKLDALVAANDRISNRLIGMENPDKEG